MSFSLRQQRSAVSFGVGRQAARIQGVQTGLQLAIPEVELGVVIIAHCKNY